MKKLTVIIWAVFLCISLARAGQGQDVSKRKVENNVEVTASDKVGAAGVNLRLPANVLPISRIIISPDGGKAIGICSSMQITPTLILTEAHCLAKDSQENVPGFAHGERIHALPTLQQDGQWRLDLSAADKNSLSLPNAQVIFYRPGFTADGSAMSFAFDMALIKLDGKLQANASMASAELQSASASVQNIPNELVQLMGGQLTQAFNQSLSGPFQNYQNFLSRRLEKFDLMAMTPDVVQRELKDRIFQIYYFGTQQGTMNRGPLKICTSPSLGVYKNNSHRMKFDFHCPEGTSGSPVLDTDRNLVVSIGGEALLSSDVCQWVKAQDARVKCLVVRGTKQEKETEATAAWGK